MKPLDDQNAVDLLMRRVNESLLCEEAGAHTKQWIQLDAKDFMHNVRQYRNFVHPRAELEKQPRFDRDSVTLCWAPVRALLNDLEEHLA